MINGYLKRKMSINFFGITKNLSGTTKKLRKML